MIANNPRNAVYVKQSSIKPVAETPNIVAFEQIVNQKYSKAQDLSYIVRSRTVFLQYDCHNHSLKATGARLYGRFWGTGFMLAKSKANATKSTKYLSKNYQAGLDKALCERVAKLSEI